MAIVLAALPYNLFELDRYTFPKELVLHACAFGAAVVCTVRARRIPLFLIDALLAGFLVMGLLSSLEATNGWLAFRALSVSVSSVVLFWCARSVARGGLAGPLLAGLAGAVVLGASTGLAQAYGLVDSSLASLTRAPGGTFGNRNFMAHLAAIGLPALLLVTLQTRRRAALMLGATGVGLVAAALILSRSRAAWLGAAISVVFLGIEGLVIGRLWLDDHIRRRALQLTAAALIGIVAAITIPNRLNWRSESPYLDSLAGVANYKEGSGRGRLIQYGNTLKMAQANPLLGVGPGNWPVHYPRYMTPGDPSYHVHDFIPTNPWPSSDWMAMLSERGVPATLLLLGVGAALAFGAWARIRRGSGHLPALTDLTLIATLIAVAVVGVFDAVLLLPVPSFFAWAIAGALASSARPIRELVLTPGARSRAVMIVAGIGAIVVLRSGAQIAAMSLYSSGGRGAVEWAQRLDPGSYRIHTLLAFTWLDRGRCKSAVPHARAARDLFPNYPAPRQILRACGSR